MYLKINEKSVDKLHLAKRPGIRSWSIVFGILSLGLGAAYYGSDPLPLKCAYIIGCLLFGLSLFEDQEDCIFDKNSGNAELYRTAVWHFILGKVTSKTEFPLHRILEVRETKREKSRSEFDVELLLSTGVAIALTEKHCFSSFSDCEHTANTIRRFLKLERVEQLEDCDDSSSCFNSAESSGDDPSDSEVENDATSSVPSRSWTPRQQVLAVNIAT